MFSLRYTLYHFIDNNQGRIERKSGMRLKSYLANRRESLSNRSQSPCIDDFLIGHNQGILQFGIGPGAGGALMVVHRIIPVHRGNA